MQITMNSQNNIAYELLFDNMIQETFGFSFVPWFERKLWDEHYESYSIIENGEMLANVCIFKTDMIVNGLSMRAHQFGGVATRKDRRGKGLSRLLMEDILAKYPDTPAFLGANPSVIDFYPRFGFRRVQTYRPIIATDISSHVAEPIKLSPADKQVANALLERGAYSTVLDSLNTQTVQMFHLLLDYSDGIYYLPECRAIVVAEQDGNRLFVADVITPRPITFDEIRREMPFAGIHTVEFGFCPDWLGVDAEWIPENMEKNPYFVRGDWTLPQNFRFPAMSET
jgi:GNAT superfamily N-acetyltransferase